MWHHVQLFWTALFIQKTKRTSLLNRSSGKTTNILVQKTTLLEPYSGKRPALCCNMFANTHTHTFAVNPANNSCTSCNTPKLYSFIHFMRNRFLCVHRALVRFERVERFGSQSVAVFWHKTKRENMFQDYAKISINLLMGQHSYSFVQNVRANQQNKSKQKKNAKKNGILSDKLSTMQWSEAMNVWCHPSRT